jgi:hypothetical protein
LRSHLFFKQKGRLRAVLYWAKGNSNQKQQGAKMKHRIGKYSIAYALLAVAAVAAVATSPSGFRLENYGLPTEI